jgi:hypothetical protein
MPGDKNDAVADQFAGECNRLLGFAKVITHN